MAASRKSFSVLQWALLFSLGVHALLLAVRFVDPEGFNRVFENTALDVVLVNTQSDEKPVKAQAIAQHNLAGGGDAADARAMATTPLPNTGQESIGVDVIDENQRRIDAMKEQQEQLLAQVREQLAAMPDAEPAQAAETPEARAQEERRRQLAKLMARIEARIQEENARPRRKFLSPATLGSTYAVYYDELRRKIERRGTENFPEFGGKKLYGELMMAILVNHDGRILDRLAEAIAQASAPFGNFTPAMRKDTDQIDITARFRFTREQTLETTLQSGQLTNAVQDKLR